MSNVRRILSVFGLLMVLFALDCASGQSQNPPPQYSEQQSAVPALPVAEPPAQAVQQAVPAPAPVRPASPFYTGDGGEGMNLTILAPTGTGLAEDQKYLPALVQGELVSNFSAYSAISVLDRQNPDKIYAEMGSGYYDDNAEAGRDLGHLIPAGYMMNGTITKTASGYSLQLNVTDTSDKTVKAAYSGTCAFAELDNLSGIRRASLDLLQKLGIEPSERTSTELAAPGTETHVQAQTALAQGITAQQQGMVVQALSYFIQANTYEPSLAEAASRLNIVSANISSGNIGADARNDLEWRDRWVARLRECEDWYAGYMKAALPPCYLVYTTDIKQGQTDYEKRTVPLSISAAVRVGPVMQWYNIPNQVVKTVCDGLIATGRAQVWQLDKWAIDKAVSPQSPFVQYVNGFSAEFEIINADGKSIAKKTIGLSRRHRTNQSSIGNRRSKHTSVKQPIKDLPLKMTAVGTETELTQICL